MIHGKVEMEVSPERYTAAQLADTRSRARGRGGCG